MKERKNDETECGFGETGKYFGQGVRKSLSKEVRVELGHEA